MFEKFLQSSRSVNIFLFLLGFLLYFNTFRNDFALDDSIVLTENSFVQQGWKGIREIFTHDSFVGFFNEQKDLVQGGRYRPLSLVTFATEVALGLDKPAFSHIVNALLYALLCVILFYTFQGIAEVFNFRTSSSLIAFLATLLFSVHPIHTEVVANIKGRDELMASLFMLLALNEYLSYLNNNRKIQLWGSTLFYFLGLLSKENAITLIPISAFIVILTLKKNFAKGSIGIVLLMIPTVIYLWMRNRFSGGFSPQEGTELMNNPFLFAESNEKIPTILFTLIWYIKLLILPHPLTFDYYPYHVALVDWHNPVVWISLLIYTLIVTGIIYYFKRIPILSFFLSFFLITLLPLSNLFINVGTFMNERFLFQPSMAYSFILAYGFIRLVKYQSRKSLIRKLLWIFFCLLLIAGSVKTVKRNQNWKNNFTLFLHDVKISSQSAKGNCMAGGILYEEALKTASEELQNDYLNQSVEYLEKSLTIYPGYIDALLLLGNAYHVRDGSCKASIEIYDRIFSLSPDYKLAFDNLYKILGACPDPQMKIKGYKSILKYKPAEYEANYEVGSIYGKVLQNLDSAIVYLHRAVELDPSSDIAHRDLGVAYAMGGEYEASLPYFEKAIELNPHDPGNYINLGITLRQLGKQKQAQELFSKAETLRHIQAE